MFSSLIMLLNSRIDEFTKTLDIKTRPNAGPGLWLMFLLPIAIIISYIQHPIIATNNYKLSTILAVGLLCCNCVFLHTINNKRLKFYNKWLIVSSLIVALLFYICLHRGFWFCLWSGVFSTIIYQEFYLFILKKLPNCFTIGEAAICCQSYIIFNYFALVNVANNLEKTPVGVVQISTTIIQQGLSAIAVIILLSYKFNIKNPIIFYTTTLITLFLFIFVFLYILIRQNAFLWIIDQILRDLFDSKIIIFWVICSSFAVVAVCYQINKATKASTATRKIFHILAVLVFIPGLLYNCSFLYLASGVVLGLFLMLELLRILDMPPLSQSLQNGLCVYGDEKDCGIIALTPIYLLVGCALPLWLHPSPCDLTNSSIFNLLPLLSGILTVGIGDTTASCVGLYFGKHKWKNTKKSIEGTLSCIISQFVVVYLFVSFGFLKMQMFDYLRTIIGILVTSVIEAKTDQVDNLVLPLVMYIILI